MEFRKLKPDEIDLRIGTVTDKGVSLLLYKNARVDMQILDETVGAENWQREHYEVKGNMFCRVGIRFASMHGDENTPITMSDVWVWKADCGVESYTEKEKGEASDSFKRACVCWGIGRELYTAPFIWIPLNKAAYENQDPTKKKLSYTYQRLIAAFRIANIGYNEAGQINELVIVDKDGNVAWRMK